MNYTNNPQTFMNSYFSVIRNSILFLSLGIGMYGYSKTFKNKNSELLLRLISVIIYFLSLILCVNSNFMFRNYNKKLEKVDKNEIPEYIVVKYWKNYEILGWFFCSIILFFFILGLQRFIVKIL